jgi:hypothetical protein
MSTVGIARKALIARKNSLLASWADQSHYEDPWAEVSRNSAPSWGFDSRSHGNAESKAKQRQRHALAHHKSEYFAPRRAESQSHADLTRALSDAKCKIGPP